MRTPVVIVVRDPDAANEFHKFGPGHVIVHDIDLGANDLSDPAEYAEWAEYHLNEANELRGHGYSEAAATIVDIVKAHKP